MPSSVASVKWSVVSCRGRGDIVLVSWWCLLVLSTLGPSINGNHVVTAAATTTTTTTTTATNANNSHVQSTPAATPTPTTIPPPGVIDPIDPAVNFRGLLSDPPTLARRSLRQPDDNYRGLVRRRWRTIMGRDPLERRSMLDAKWRQKREAPMAAGQPDTMSSSSLNLSCHQVHRFRNTFDTNITGVDLSCNGLRDHDMPELSFGHLPALRRLALANNRLTAADLVDLRPVAGHLSALDLAGNQIAELRASSFALPLPQLERLSLAHNQIATIEPGTFAGLQSLQVLDLSHNRLDARAVPALQAIQGLVAMSVAFNARLGEALPEFVASWSLKELDASGTGLCRVPAALAQSVHALNVSYNHFEIIRRGDMDSYPLLKYLDLSHNSIADVEDDALGRLEILVTLQLQHNLLAAVPTNLPASLVHLLLHDNRIADIVAATFAQLDSLQTLDLSGNRLMYVPALPLPRLVSLDLRSSGVQGVSQAVVRMSPHLKDLLLEGNPIKCTALMSIAEWTTICRSVAPGPEEAATGRTEAPQFESLLAPQPERLSCCGRMMEGVEKADDKLQAVACKHDAANEVKLSKKSRKLKMADIWHDLWINNSTGSPDRADEINSVSHLQATTVAPVAAPAKNTATPPGRRRNGKSLTMAAAQSADVRQAKKTKRISPSTTTTTTTTTTTATAPLRPTMVADKMAMLSLGGDGEKKPAKPAQDKASVATSSAAIAGKLQINSNSLSTTGTNNEGAENNSSTGSDLPAVTTSTTPTTPALTTTPPPESRTPSTTPPTTALPKSTPVKADESRTTLDMASLSVATPTPTLTPRTVTTQKDDDVPAAAGLTTPPPQSPTRPPALSSPATTAATTTGEPTSPGITDDGTNAAEFVRNQWSANPVATTTTITANNNGPPATSITTVAVAPPPTANPVRPPKRSAEVSPSASRSSSSSSASSNIYVAEQSLVAQIDFTHSANGPMLVVGVGDQTAAASSADVVVHGHTTTATAPPAAAAAAAASAVHEQWTAAAASAPESDVARHPGMFIVLGITIGMVVSVLAVQMWRCARRSQQRRGPRLRGLSADVEAEAAGAAGGGGRHHRLAGYEEADDGDQYAPSHRDMLPMELLGAAAGSTIQYSEAPIELW